MAGGAICLTAMVKSSTCPTVDGVALRALPIVMVGDRLHQQHGRIYNQLIQHVDGNRSLPSSCCVASRTLTIIVIGWGIA